MIKQSQIDLAQLGKILRKAQYSRERSDYGDYTTVTKEEVENQINDATNLINDVKRILDQETGKSG